MGKSLNTFFSTLFFLFTLFLICCLCFGFTFSSDVLGGVNLFIASILPTLFPYFFITTILFELKQTRLFSNKLSPLFSKFFHVGKASCFAFIVGVFSGYPIGAMTVASLKNNGFIDDGESVRSSILCSTCSPYFCLYSVGIIAFNNLSIGIVIFLIHLFCSLVVSLIFSKLNKNKTFCTKTPLPKHRDNGIFYDSVLSSALAILCVGFIVAITYYFLQLLSYVKALDFLSYLFCRLGLDKSLANGMSLGIFEVGLGIKNISSTLSPLSLSLTSALISFGGISYILQSVFFLKNVKIKTAPFVSFTILKAVLSFAISFLIFSFVF